MGFFFFPETHLDAPAAVLYEFLSMLLSYRDPDFWKKFQSEHWRPRIPGVLRDPFPVSPFSQTSLLRAMKTFQAGQQSGDARLRYLFSLGGKRAAHRTALKKIFKCENETLAQLEHNCSRLYPEKNFGMMINNLQAIDSEIWGGITGFLQDAHPWVDYPVALSVLDLFWGRYSSSFLGLHKDTQEIFGFVVQGEKTILAWPFEYFISRVPGLTAGARYFQTDLPIDYRKYRKDALVLHARPGDIIYWPSDYWHIAEGNPGKWTAMLSLGLFLPSFVSSEGAEKLARFREPLLAPTTKKRTSPLRSGDLTSVTEDTDGPQRLRWATGFGFRFGGPVTESFLRASSPTNASQSLRKNATSLLLWRREKKTKRLFVSTNGYSVSLPFSGKALEVLAQLAAGEIVCTKKESRNKKVKANFLANFWDLDGVMKTRRILSDREDVAWLIDWLLSVEAIAPVSFE